MKIIALTNAVIFSSNVTFSQEKNEKKTIPMTDNQNNLLVQRTSSLKTIFSNSLRFSFFEFKISVRKTIAKGINIANTPSIIF
jgi:hypothetical protein